jgi:hypothetical protein
MFEQTLQEMICCKHFEKKEVAVLDQYGIAKFAEGSRQLTYAEAADLVEKMKRVLPRLPKYLIPRFRACMNSIRNAFGPEFWELH